MKIGFNRASGCLAAVLGVAIALAWPVLANGFPFVFYDSADYIEGAFTGQVPIFRALPYALFLAPVRLPGGLWLPILIQIGLVALLLGLLARRFKGGWPLFLALGLAAGGLSSASWYAGLLMPDIFAGIAILGAILILTDGESSALARLLLIALTALAAFLHATHLMVLIGLALVGLVLWRLSWIGRRGALTLVGVALIVGLAIPSLHRLAAGEFTLNRGGTIFLLARTVEPGLLAAHLDRVCPQKPYRACALRDRLHGEENDFLWGHGGVFFQDDEPLEIWRKEAAELLGAIVRENPGAAAAVVLKGAGRQFLSFGAGDVFTPMDYHMGHAVERHFPKAMATFRNAGQEQRWKAPLWLDRMGRAAGWASLLLVPLLSIWALRKGERVAALIGFLTLVALAGNALACGGLSSVADRYQARVLWVAVAVATALLIRICRRRPAEPDSRAA
ncbi:MAG: hypothetical protein HZC25_14240 [Rhodospirillales bacterium]|nr:hypothetical protein [Rhodospirillales bacterium]